MPNMHPAELFTPNGALAQGAATSARGVWVASRPDGSIVVAVEAAFPDDSVKLYDCASGRPLASLRPLTQAVARNTSREVGETSVLRWSPDGSSLALFDTKLGRITIWSGSSLPH